MSKIIQIELTPEQRSTLELWLRSGKTEQRLALRARMILMTAEGVSTGEIAEKLGVWPRWSASGGAVFPKRVWKGCSMRPARDVQFATARRPEAGFWPYWTKTRP